MRQMKYIVASIILVSLMSCREKKKTSLQNAEVFYTCSMHPQVIEPKPGKCPICHMDLIPVERKKGEDADAIMLSDQQIQLGNIQVDTVGKGIIGDETVLTATLNIDETKATTVSASISGGL